MFSTTRMNRLVVAGTDKQEVLVSRTEAAAKRLPNFNMVLSFFIIFLIAYSSQPQASIITYDFRSTDAQVALDGLVSGTFTVDGVSLGVEAGISDSGGTFVSGTDTLSIDLFEGLGVNGEQIRDVRGSGGLLTTAVQFTFDPYFTQNTITTITLNRYFSGEDLVVYTDGVFLGRLNSVFDDFPFVVLDAPTGLTEVVLGRLDGISNLLITTSVEYNDDSDFYITAIQGTTIPEPSTIVLLCIGLLGVAFTRQRYKITI